ncbi:MAG: hypothetical protein AAF138_00865 [Planctomycetota bacterium]
MTTVLLISERWNDTDDARGGYARTLAELFAARGHTVLVLARRDGPPIPALGIQGRIEIHSLDIRAKAPTSSFAVEAARRTGEIAASRPLEAILCIDCPEACAALDALRHQGEAQPLRTPVTDIIIDPTRNDPAVALAALASDAQVALKDGALDLAHRAGRLGARRFVIAPPVGNTRSIGPEDTCDAFVLMDDPTPDSARFVARAFVRSGAARAGWAVATPGAPGRWLVSLGRPAGAQADRTPERVAIFTGRPGHAWAETPAAVSTLAAGVTPILASSSPLCAWLTPDAAEILVYTAGDDASLAACMARLSAMPAEERAELGARLANAIALSSDPERVASQHMSVWRHARPGTAPVTRPSDRLAAWRTLEHKAKHKPEPTQETVQ